MALNNSTPSIGPASPEVMDFLVATHASIIQGAGLSHDNLEYAFGKVVWRDAKPEALEDFNTYYNELSRPVGYLRNLFDYTYLNMVPNLEPPAIPFTRSKARLFWCLSSLAVASNIVSKATNTINPIVSAGDIRRATFVHTDKPVHVTAYSLSRRGIARLHGDMRYASGADATQFQLHFL